MEKRWNFQMLKQILHSKSVETFKALLPIQILVPCKLIIKRIFKAQKYSNKTNFAMKQIFCNWLIQLIIHAWYVTNQKIKTNSTVKIHAWTLFESYPKEINEKDVFSS